MESLSLSFNGTKKHCTVIPLSSEYSGICVYSVSTVIRSGGLNTLCLELRPQDQSIGETAQVCFFRHVDIHYVSILV